MPKFALEIKATLENVESFSLQPPYIMSVKQVGGNEERDDVEIDPENEEEVSGSKGTAHFKMKFDKKDKMEATVNVIKKGSCNKSDAWVRVLVFETRGLEFTKWKPTEANVIAKSGAEFNEADISDADGFSDFDEKNNSAVSIMNIEHRFATV